MNTDIQRGGSATENPTDHTEIILSITIPITVAIVITILLVVCIIVCHKAQHHSNPVREFRGKILRYKKPSLDTELSNMNSASQLTTKMENQATDETEYKQLNRQSTVSQQNEAYGIIVERQIEPRALQENPSDENERKLCKRQSTVSQQNEEYGVLLEVRREKTIMQQNETYSMTKDMNQSDNGQKDNEYDYVRFQR